MLSDRDAAAPLQAKRCNIKIDAHYSHYFYQDSINRKRDIQSRQPVRRIPVAVHGVREASCDVRASGLCVELHLSAAKRLLFKAKTVPSWNASSQMTIVGLCRGS